MRYAQLHEHLTRIYGSISQAQATTSQSTRPRRSLSRKISRRYTPSTARYSSQSQTPTDANGAGPSGVEIIEWDPEDEVPTSPTTEYPDQFGGPFLPGYIEKAHDDPNASVSLGLGGGEDDDYTAPPPEDTYEESIADSRYTSMDSRIMHEWRARDLVPEQVSLAPDAETAMSACICIFKES